MNFNLVVRYNSILLLIVIPRSLCLTLFFLLSLPPSMHLIQVDSVQRWMEDLKLMTDCECMCILQSKPISAEKDEQNELILSSQYSTSDNLQLLLKRAWIISTELTRIAQKLEKNRWQRVHSMTVRVNCHVRSMINEYNAFTRSSSEEMNQVRMLHLMSILFCFFCKFI